MRGYRHLLAGMALIAALVVVLGGHTSRAAQSTSSEWAAKTCSAEAPPATETASSDADARLLTDQYPGITDRLLASAAVDRVPQGQLRLILKELVLEPQAGANTRSAGGPLLYVVEDGEVAIYPRGSRHLLTP